MKSLWKYGTSKPLQRVGVIILMIGILSLISWMIKEDVSLSDLTESYYRPRASDSLFFHLFFYLIPLGLLMSWGYGFLVKIYNWIINTEEAPPKIKNPRIKNPRIKKPANVKNLHFKNNQVAFEFANTIFKPMFYAGQMSFGIVRDIVLDSENKQFLIELANDSSKVIVSGINNKHSEKIQIGNLVYWGFASNIEANSLNICAVGHVLAILNPEFDPYNKKWEVRTNLTK